MGRSRKLNWSGFLMYVRSVSNKLRAANQPYSILVLLNTPSTHASYNSLSAAEKKRWKDAGKAYAKTPEAHEARRRHAARQRERRYPMPRPYHAFRNRWDQPEEWRAGNDAWDPEIEFEMEHAPVLDEMVEEAQTDSAFGSRASSMTDIAEYFH